MVTHAARLVLAMAGIVFCHSLSADSLFAADTSNALIAKLQCPDRVNGVAYSTDGQFLAAGYGWNEDGGVRVWSTTDRSIVRTLATKETKNGPEDVEKVAFSPDNKLLAAATRDGDILLWRVGVWGEPRRIVLGVGTRTKLVFSPDSRFLAVSSDAVVFLCDVQTLNSRRLGPNSPRQNSIAAGFSTDGNRLAVCHSTAVQWWDVATGRTDEDWKASGLDFFCELSTTRTHLLKGGGAVYGEKNVELMNALDGKSLGRVSEIRSGLFASAISHAERWIALGGGDYGSGGDLSLWTVEGFHEVAFTSIGRFPLMDLAFSPSDAELAAGSGDGVVFLYSVERLRGVQRTKQEYPICGELAREDKRLFLVPVAKIPTPMSSEFSDAWRIEVTEPGALANFVGFPVSLQDWDIESNAATDKARVQKFAVLSSRSPKENTEFVVFGDVQNPGWDDGFVLKIYGENSFVAANNSGKCLAYGRLSNLDFTKLKDRLVREGLLDIPRDPLTRGLDHYRTRFIAMSVADQLQIRSDAEVLDFSRTRPTKKEEEFTGIFKREQQFIETLLRAGMHVAP